ncbi:MULTISPECIES: aldo/keto reductase [unclassified Nocardioides]|uniref:aldo/keto reductase n=1 Tax=unclassified Nocardioides TaxID=2615069 RepID=UPI0007032EA6|nr:MULTISPECIES: aldo/keto reductase [unclassified Nocardioides]KRC52983.1 aldo/keto reductase [Nocardioides sp. Root79]KRC72512.1 aldo/keto reductase [Nocardioides sp. Root240]
MEQRTFGRTGRAASVVGLGTWQLGADWGDVSEADARAVLEASAEAGVTFYDTADVYGDGRSEQIVGRFLADHADDEGAGFTAVTKMGRRAEQVPASYVLDNFRAWLDRSRRNLGVDTIDLVQLHCPPSEVIDDDATYDALDTLVADGVIAAYGVSVETCAQALSAIARPGVQSVQIILNAFRLKPLDEVLPAAAAAETAIIARVPLASGLLSGRYDESTVFAADDHRSYNRDGSAFDVGETFSGVDYRTGIAAAADFTRLVDATFGGDVTPAQAAIAWCWQQPGVTTVIPGARSVAQAEANAAAGLVGALPADFLDGVRAIYDRDLREAIHPRW